MTDWKTHRVVEKAALETRDVAVKAALEAYKAAKVTVWKTYNPSAVKPK